ncbi:hypothetical protein BC936DRAFT_144501 [Jimgerdemannia flammicorona]|uniref:GDS1 winged helix domain-containing protein n=1 Tax=Jimgerdemannia flammicorona TaxID=994334 RepID=A0A433DCB3_9FUNG|nr:hypothetical protein BC936DRAFT_144501 [Jimgerdemannia flammicorona]
MPTSNHHSRITQPPDGNSYPPNAMLASAAEIEAAIPTRTRTRSFHRPLTTRPRKVSTVNSTEIPLSSPPSSQDHSEWGEPIDVDLVDEEQQSSPQLTPTSSTTPDHRSLSIEPQSKFCDNIASSSSLDDQVQRCMHRDDARDQLFVGIIKALVHVNNTPSSPKDLAKYIMEENFAILGSV